VGLNKTTKHVTRIVCSLAETSIVRVIYFAFLVSWIALGDLVVACLPLDPRFVGINPAEDDGFLRADPKFAGLNPAEDDGLLRAIKILSTTPFGGEVKPSVSCHKFTACYRTLRA
jgi:hypothetical protein